EAVAAKLIEAIEGQVRPAEAAVQGAREALQKTATEGLEGMVTQLTLPERQLLKSETGQAVRNAVIAKRDTAKAEADTLYVIVRNSPGGTGKTFETLDLANDARRILQSIPRK